MNFLRVFNDVQPIEHRIRFVRLNHSGDSAGTKHLVRNGFALSIGSTLIVWNAGFAIRKVFGS